MATRRRVRGWFGRDPERDVDQELSFHVEMRVEELVARGEPRDRAERLARERFGDYEAARRACVTANRAATRRMVWTQEIDGLFQDVRDAVRTLARAPAFTAAAVLTLAIGLTGVIVMVTLVHGILLSPLPVPAEDELVVGWRGQPDATLRRWPFTTTELDVVRRESAHFSAVAGVGYTDPWPMLVSARDESFGVDMARVTGSFFTVLGAPAILGRTLAPSDDVSGAENALVLSHDLWRNRFGADRAVLGRHLRIGGQSFTVVGVMGPDVDHPPGVAAWTTIAAMQTTTSSSAAKAVLASELYLFARLRQGTSTAIAEQGLRTMAPALDALRPAGQDQGFVPHIQSYRDHLVGDVRRPLLVLFGAVTFVLLLACANVAGLSVVRGDARRVEMAVRAALGAGPGRLARHAFAEAVILALLAGVLSVSVAHVLLPGLLAWVPDGLPRSDTVQMDRAVVAASLCLALAAAMIAAMPPAAASWRVRLMAAVQNSVRGSTTADHRGMRHVLVTAQVALAVVGLVGVGLMTGSLQHLRRAAASLASDELVIAPLVMPQAKYADRTRWRGFVTNLTTSLAADPRVHAVTPVNATPFSGKGWEIPVVTAEGQSDDEARGNPALSLEEVDPSYFTTFEVPLVAGRGFTAADRAGAVRVAIITTDVAARLWPGADALGKRLKWGGASSSAEWLTVVGIAAPTGYRDLRAPWPSLYVPADQMLGAADQIVIRSAMPLAQVAALVQARVQALDADVQLIPPRPFAALLEVPIAGPRFYASLMTVFGLTGVALAVVGLYGVIAAGVRQRRREFGVRLALGAEPGDVRRLVFVDGARLVGVGLVVGLAAALVAAQALRGLLYGVAPVDATSLVGAAVGIVIVSAAALIAPLRAAGRVPPADVLRAE